jgi:Putative peptidoglycan binding domain
MTKFVTILMVCSLAFAAGVRAEQEQEKNKKKAVQQSKATAKPQFNARPHTATRTHVEGAHNTLKSTHNNVRIHNTNNNVNIHNTKVSKQNLAAQSNNVRNIHSEHMNFHAQPKAGVASVQFNQNYHIQGSANWKGNNYVVFRSYHPVWHDQFWWHSHFNNIVLIGGGWYYWNAGYWCPAWGYDPGVAYYPYDGPIYVGARATPPDQVIADVQGSLQQQGYYQGEVDGLLGPLTRAALASYQQDHGLSTTSAIDEPTLDSLGLS